MSRRYLRNGTPIGEYRVYVVVVRIDTPSTIFEVSGMSTYEEAENMMMLEGISGTFGNDYDRIVLTRPGVDLSRARLHKAALRQCDIRGANLYKSHMLGADFSGSNMSNCNIVGVDGSYSNLSRCDLSGSKMWASFFRESNMKGAILDDIKTSSPDRVPWLETNFEDASYPSGRLPSGWVRNSSGHLKSSNGSGMSQNRRR